MTGLPVTWVRLVAVATVLTLGAMACGGGGDASGSSTTTQTQTSTTTVTTATRAETTAVTTTTTTTETAPITTFATRPAEVTSTSTTTATSSVAGELNTTTESVYFNLDNSPGYPLLVAAAAINNYAGATLEGAEARIDLLDASGANVGSATFPLPNIGPVQSYVLVVQATGVGADKIHGMYFTVEPASLVATIVTPGHLSDAPSSGILTSDIKVYASTSTPNAYVLEATLVTTEPVLVSDIGYKTALLLDAGHNVVGLGLGRADTTGLSTRDPLPAGTRIPVKATVLNPTAEVTAGLFNVFVEP